MPSGLIDEEDGMGSRCDGFGDFGVGAARIRLQLLDDGLRHVIELDRLRSGRAGLCAHDSILSVGDRSHKRIRTDQVIRPPKSVDMYLRRGRTPQ